MDNSYEKYIGTYI